ncbi:MAG TPA: hypothetical protein VK806_12970 [Bacteroidia bacterium]|jgi:hypothetical protein|nr:hypothetical protein [Bacteroidia bacterium]
MEKGKGIYELTIKEVIENPDNSILILAEQYDGGGYTNGTDYNYNDVLIIKVKPNGTQDWITRIHKKQNNQVPYFADMASSVGYDIVGNNMYLVYNDNEQNAKLSTDEIDAKGDDIKTIDLEASSSELILETLDLANGSIKRSIIPDQYGRKGDKTVVFCGFTKQMGDKFITYRTNFRHNMDQFGQIFIQ